MRSRMIAVSVGLIVALALVTGSVLLVGYVAAAASLLIVVSLLARRAIRGRSGSQRVSAVPRWVESADREAA